MIRTLHVMVISLATLAILSDKLWAGDTRESATYKRIKSKIDAIPAIDTHDHLPPFDSLRSFIHTKQGREVNLHGLWRNSYLTWYNPMSSWNNNDDFDSWWRRGKEEFKNVRATSFYRYQLPAFRDLYGVDFDRITDADAKKLNQRIIDNYKDERWIYQVVTEKANIELMFNDPFWNRLGFKQSYPLGSEGL